MNGLWRRVIAGIVVAAVVAGGSGLIIAYGLAREVEDLKKAEAQRQARELKTSERVARIDANVQSLKEQVKRTETKLDRLLERQLERQ